MKTRTLPLLICMLSVVLISCGGGGVGETTAPADTGNSSPSVDGNDTGSGPGTGLPANDSHILGPSNGEELDLYHAELVMNVLRLLQFADYTFLGANVGRSMPFGIAYDLQQDEVVNGSTSACQSAGTTRGVRTLTWDNGGTAVPTQYTSTQTFSDCRQAGLNLGNLVLYDGMLTQGGNAMTGGLPHAIQAGVLNTDQFTISDEDNEIGVTFNGSIGFNLNNELPYTIEISNLDLDIHEVNDSWASAGRYVEDISVSGRVTFESLSIQSNAGVSTIKGIKDATLRFNVRNNNHDTIAFLVETIPVSGGDFFYSLSVRRNEASIDPANHHSLRIDRLNQTSRALFNVSMDFNMNGVIEESGVFPREFYPEVPLLQPRWGSLRGL